MDKYDMDKKKNELPDESMQVFTYGNVKIIDLETKEILVNKRF